MKLDKADVSSMVRLVGEVAALPGNHADKKRHVMQGLCSLIQADAWIWGLACQREPDKPRVYISMLKDGFSDETFVKFLQALEHPAMVAFGSAFFNELEEKKSHLTRRHQQIIKRSRFQNSTVQALWKESNLGPLILSMRPIDDKSTSAIGIYRRYDRPHFTARESRIAHILLAEIPWLHQQGWPDDRGISVPTLTKRQRLALNLLTLGHSHKDAALHMNISINTLRGYVKEIYRHFGVRSQAALMSRFFQGDGHDVPR